MARAKVRISRRQIEDELTLKIDRSKEVAAGGKAFATKVFRHLVDKEMPSAGDPDHPYATDDLKNSVKLVRNQTRTKTGRFRRNGRVYYTIVTDNPHAGYYEYGTGWDAPGTNSPWGRKTPTPEFAPFARTAHFFRGTVD